MTEKEENFYLLSRDYGEVKSENMVFNAYLLEFASQVDSICCLETIGQIQTLEAYQQIKRLCQQFELFQTDNGQP